MKINALSVMAVLCAFSLQALAEPLKEAKINQIVNDVKIVEPRQGARPAALHDLIKEDLGVATGIQSRAELLFQDSTLTRLGAETFFSFEPGTRNITLQRGAMLLQVPKDHGGARIRAASVSASITGTTIMVELLPGRSVKVTVLEGSLHISVDAHPERNMELRAGKMVIVSPTALTPPKPVDVNLRNLVRTSALIDPAAFNGKTSATAAVLPSMGLIEKVIAQQGNGGTAVSETTASSTVPATSSTGTPAASVTSSSSTSAGTGTSSPQTTASSSTGSVGQTISEPAANSASASSSPAASSSIASTASTGFTASTSYTASTSSGASSSSFATIPTLNGVFTGTTTTLTSTPPDNAATLVTSALTTDAVSSTPVVTAPVVTAPVVTAPVVTAPVVTAPVVTAPVVTAPVVTAPVVTAPVVTTPVVTTPVVTAPLVTAPVVTTPPVTTPPVTAPVVTTPPVAIVAPSAPLATAILTPPANTNPAPTVYPTVITAPAPYVIGAGTVINTSQTSPSITTNGISNGGILFQNLPHSGSPSKFLFSSSSTFDGQMSFDNQFNQQFSNTTVYEFSSLELQASPILALNGGTQSIALISGGDIVSGPLPTPSSIIGLKQLFLGTVNGSISLNNSVGFGAAQGSSLNFLQLYARNGNVDFGAPVTMSGGQLYISAQNDVTVDPSSVIAVSTASLTGMGNVAFAGSLNANTTQMDAGSTLRVSGSVTSQNFYGIGSSANVTGSISTNQGTLKVGSDIIVVNGASIDAQQLYLSAGGLLQVDGTVSSTNGLTVGATNFVVNGMVNTAQNLSVTANTATIAGSVSGANTNATYTVNNTFTEAPGALLKQNNLTITAGGGITLGAVTNGQNISLTSGIDPLQGGGIAFNGNVTSQQLQTSGPSVTVNSSISTKDATFNSGGNFLLNAGGSITGTGNTAINGSGLIELDGQTSANNLSLGGTASVVINGALHAQTLSTANNASLQDVAVNSPVTLTKDLNMSMGGNFLVSNTGSLAAGGNVNITAANGINFSGAVSGNNYTLSSGGGLTISAPVMGLGSFASNSSAAMINSTVSANQMNFKVSGAFNLAPGAGLVATHDVQITCTGNGITLSGSVASNNLTLAAPGLITVGGTVQSTGNVQIATGGQAATDVLVSGQISGQSIQMQPLSTLHLTPTGTLNSSGQVNLSAAQITLDGQVTGGQVTVGNNQTTAVQIGGVISGSSVGVSSTGTLGIKAGASLQSTGQLNVSGQNTTISGSLVAPTVSITGSSSLFIDPVSSFISANSVTLNSAGTLALTFASGGSGGLDLARLATLNATGNGIVVPSNLALPAGNSSLTAGASGIAATGADLSGFQNITVNGGGSYSGANLSATNVNISQGGNLNLTGNLASTGKVSVSGAINAAGQVTANNLTAGTSLSAQSLSAGSVTTASLSVGAGGITPYAGGPSTINAPTIASPLGLFMNGTAGTLASAPGNGSSLSLTTGTLAVDSSSSLSGTVSTANFDGGDANLLRSDAGGNGGTFNVTSSGNVTVNSPISANTGMNSKPGMTGGNGGTVNVTATGAIAVNSTIKVSSTETSTNLADNTLGRASLNGGTVNLTSKQTTGTAIAVNNTGQILALLNAASPGKGGTINFTSAGGAINVNGRVQADNGTINMVNNGPSGVVQLTNATLSADVVKVGALGANGQLIVGGGTINANTSLKLYAGSGNGQVLFNDNVNLNGASTKIIAGSTVTVANGKTVNVGGSAPANVYANTANYTGSGGNGATSGVFAGKGATTSALKNAPAF